LCLEKWFADIEIVNFPLAVASGCRVYVENLAAEQIAPCEERP